jgi:hypothetical protein
VVLISREELAALIEEASSKGAARALAAHREQAAPRSLGAQEAADIYTGGDLARWRNRRHDHPEIDAEAAIGPPGKLRRWDSAKLEKIMGELRPKLRRRAPAAAG